MANGSPLLPERTFVEVAQLRFVQLCEAAGFSSTARLASRSLIEELLDPWGRRAVGSTPPTRSDVTDDHGPIEFSLALSGAAPEVRLLFEAQGRDTSKRAQWQEGARLNALLERRYQVNLERLQRIEDLFVPSSERVRFAIWHSLSMSCDGAPRFKLYLNPQAQGGEHAQAVVAEALARLGFPRAARELSRTRRHEDELSFFSLDLHDSADARVKIYKVHYRATRADIEAELAAAELGPLDGLGNFWNAMVGREGPFDDLPMSTYLSLTSEADRPTTGTLHFPVRAYSANDKSVYDRTLTLLDHRERAIYERAIGTFARRPLATGVGMHSYVSYRQHRGRQRITVYLTPELYQVAPARKAVA
jgi:DMATS type aromatic prenyltransferase